MQSRGMAFGVDPQRQERYSLRQARYFALAEDIGRWIDEASRAGRTLKFLDVGVHNGVSLRYIEQHDELGTLEYHGVDLKLRDDVYRPEVWRSLTADDLMLGLPKIPSATFDIVICEQVLEHLPEVETALAALARVTKPGGRLILGVPIFTPPCAPIRKYLVPLWDKLIGQKKVRGHLQAFTRGSFVRAVEKHAGVEVRSTRGFRIVSGGWLRPLENQRWWWQLQTALGRLFPGLCVEVQVLAQKPGRVPTDEALPVFETTAERMNAVTTPR